MLEILKQLPLGLQQALMVASARALEQEDYKSARLMTALLPYVYPSACIAEDALAKPKDMVAHMLEELLSEEELRELAADPIVFCGRYLKAFYAAHLDCLLDEIEQRHLVEALGVALEYGAYDSVNWKDKEISLHWFEVLKPLLRPPLYAKLQVDLARYFCLQAH